MIRLDVDEARIPNLSSLAPRENPSASIGTINAEIPLCLIVVVAVLSKKNKNQTLGTTRNKHLYKIMYHMQYNKTNIQQLQLT
jgi:hypothetical protein